MNPSIESLRNKKQDQKLEEFLSSRILTENGCLISPKQRIYYRKKVWFLPHLLYSLEHGEIPRYTRLIHSCKNPLCSALEHLYLGTKKGESELEKAEKELSKFYKSL